MEDFGTHAHGFREALRADWHDHEFLDVDRIVSMRAAIDDVHHRRRQNAGIGSTHISVEGHSRALGSSFCKCHGDAQNRIRAEAGLVFRSIQIDHQHVDHALFGCVQTSQFVEDFTIHGVNGLQHALAEITRLVPITLFMGLIRTRRSARRDCRAAERAIFQRHINFDGWVASAIQDFPGMDVDDLAHEWLYLCA